MSTKSRPEALTPLELPGSATQTLDIKQQSVACGFQVEIIWAQYTFNLYVWSISTQWLGVIEK